jgi:hypothetical protein
MATIADGDMSQASHVSAAALRDVGCCEGRQRPTKKDHYVTVNAEVLP